mmetsp:Transcript_9138/g.17226  ORF Transcript_9138/g.17226 Transcript_9138/m.17226 type:complete len:282 (+) Transcript_9138:93-938(+)
MPTPRTPRARVTHAFDDNHEHSTPPNLNRCTTWHSSAAKVPPKAPRCQQQCPLLDALRNGRTGAVEALLRADPLAALMPTCSSWEPPVLAAVRSGCQPRTLALLLRHGASVDAVDDMKLTALAMLPRAEEVFVPVLPSLCGEAVAPGVDKPLVRLPGSHRIFATPESCEERCCNYASTLLWFGADRHFRDEDGLTAAERAEAHGQVRLSGLIRHWAGCQARTLRTLRYRIRTRQCCHDPSRHVSCPVCMTDDVFERICDMLAPGAPRVADLRHPASSHGGA